MALGRRVLIRNAALLAAAEGCARRIAPAASVSGTLDAAGHVLVRRSAAPQLDQPGGAVAVRLVSTSGSPQPFGVLLVNLGPKLSAYDRDCPHASCELTWVPEDRQVECPCHGSRFASDGTVLNPPATTAIGNYPTARDQNGDIVVTLFPGDGTYPAPDANRLLTLDLASYPALGQVGGFVVGFVEGPPGALLVLRVSGSEVVALDARCTHQSCIVRPAAGRIHCPCHRSQFHLDGTLISQSEGGPIGPASFPLHSFKTTLAGGSVAIDLSS